MSPCEHEIRTATSDDYAGLCAVHEQVDALHREHLPWLFRAPDSPPRSLQYFRELIEGVDSTVLVAEAGEIVGAAVVLMRAAPALPIFVPQRWAVIDGIVVAGAWRRRGIATMLADAAEAWARALGAAWVELNVYEFNTAASAFYRSRGYGPLSSKLRKPIA
jgi:ribosomal protein S18 acetylase RimI-like enzyme